MLKKKKTTNTGRFVQVARNFDSPAPGPKKKTSLMSCLNVTLFWGQEGPWDGLLSVTVCHMRMTIRLHFTGGLYVCECFGADQWWRPFGAFVPNVIWFSQCMTQWKMEGIGWNGMKWELISGDPANTHTHTHAYTLLLLLLPHTISRDTSSVGRV